MSKHQSFILVETKELPDIYSTGYLYRHKKTGAEVLYLKNKDDNKAFTISFRTPPYDDNGIAHIIEHSVLNGSKKYPSKEPFVELLKGSLNTFLNAMTYADKTVYPVASRNQQDFTNLVGVYLDAVFAPKLYEDSQILMQEGWHYHLEQPEDELIYKGVVYNEMRGAFSQPESVLYRSVQAELFPDTIYAHESGGTPAAIPTLTQEKFIEFHQTYYHPSNAKVILYGDLAIDQALEQLAEYFDAYEAKEYVFDQYIQQPFTKTKEVTHYYSLAAGDSTEDKSLLMYAWATGTSLDAKLAITMTVLEEILLGSNSAPLKRVLLQSGLGSQVIGGYQSSIYSPYFDVTLKDTNPTSKEQFVSIIRTELQRLVTEGIPQKTVQSALNKIAFRYKESTSLEGSTPKGVLYAVGALASWLYEDAPYEYLAFSAILNELNELASQGYFEQIIQDYLLNNKHAAIITLVPKAGMNDEKDARLAEQLAAYKASLTAEEIQTLVASTQALLERQNQPDDPADLAKIPKLTRADVNPKSEELILQVDTVQEHPFLYYQDQTNGIGYVKYYFDMTGIPTDLIPAVSFMSEILTDIATQNYTEAELRTEIDYYTGDISANTRVLVESVDQNVYYPQFTLSGKALSNYLPKLIELIEEISLRSTFEQVDKLRELLLNTKARLEMDFNYGAHSVAVKRLQSYYSQAAKYDQLLEGIDYYDYIVDLLEHFEQRSALFIEQLETARKLLFKRENVTASFVGSKEDYETFCDVTQLFYAQLFEGASQSQPFTASVEILNEGFKTAQDIQYVAKGYNQTLVGEPLHGKNGVIRSILGLDYLWNEVRVKGGAYGGLSVLTKTGEVISVSYRDPNLVETLEVYDRAADYLATYDPTDAEFEKSLIGTFSSIDHPLSAAQKGNSAFDDYFTHQTHAMKQQLRDELLHATPQQIRDYAPIMQKVIDQDAFVVIGNASKIEAEKNRFKKIRQLFH